MRNINLYQTIHLIVHQLAANVISVYSSSGPSVWKDKDGKMLKELI